ncbi:hypothetical protein D3C71_2240110 [compost metagenome]
MFALEDLKRRAVHEALVHAWHKMLAAPVGEAYGRFVLFDARRTVPDDLLFPIPASIP